MRLVASLRLRRRGVFLVDVEIVPLFRCVGAPAIIVELHDGGEDMSAPIAKMEIGPIEHHSVALSWSKKPEIPKKRECRDVDRPAQAHQGSGELHRDVVCRLGADVLNDEPEEPVGQSRI